jgi:hypothetical protein
MQFEEED